MQSNDDADTAGTAHSPNDRPAYGTRADYLEINGGTTTPATPDHLADPVEGGPELVDRLRNVYGSALPEDEDRTSGG